MPGDPMNLASVLWAGLPIVFFLAIIVSPFVK
jgi:hypothetical protein